MAKHKGPKSKESGKGIFANLFRSAEPAYEHDVEVTGIYAVAKIHNEVVERVAGWVWIHNSFLVFTLSIYVVNVVWLADFYLNWGDAESFSPTFRWSMSMLVAVIFLLTNVFFRTHGTLFSQVDRAGVGMLFCSLIIIIALDPVAIPGASAILFLFYVLHRKGNRRRLLVLATIITLSVGAIVASPWFTNIIYQGFFGGILSGAGTAYVIRLFRTYQSGGVFNTAFQENWKTYDMAKEQLNTFDIILESESESSASRLTALWSRSPWTHTAMVVKNPPDDIRKLYGIPTQAEARATAAALSRKKLNFASQDKPGSTHRTQDRLAKKIREAQYMAGETLFVYEAVRPRVKLTPLKAWMIDKEKNHSKKTVGLVPLRMHNGKAKVELNHQGLIDVMTEMHGTQFVEDPKVMIRANYQLNKNKSVEQVFCSELVALIYQRVGLLSTERDASNFTPSDWVPNTSGIEEVRLLVDAKLDNTVRLRERELAGKK